MNLGWRENRLKSGADVGVIIGRFEPAHNGHEVLFQEALGKCHVLLVILGSADKAPDIANPWTQHDRTAMLSLLVDKHNGKSKNPKDIKNFRTHVHFISVPDYYDDTKWLIDLKGKVSRYINENDNVFIFGNKKDSTSYYLDLFPDWQLIETGLEFQHGKEFLSATHIRDIILGGNPEGMDKNLMPLVPNVIREWLLGWAQLDEYQRLRAEYAHVQKQKKAWGTSPFPVFFLTVDSIITHKGKVLLIERDATPGRGLLSLPGGFLKLREKLFPGAIRTAWDKGRVRLQEEWCVKQDVFDDPRRSQRGRIITHAYRFDIPKANGLPQHALEDSTARKWVDISDISLYQLQCFEDHSMIIKEMML